MLINLEMKIIFKNLKIMNKNTIMNKMTENIKMRVIMIIMNLVKSL